MVEVSLCLFHACELLVRQLQLRKAIVLAPPSLKLFERNATAILTPKVNMKSNTLSNLQSNKNNNNNNIQQQLSKN
jgi:hypothetical protein